MMGQDEEQSKRFKFQYVRKDRNGMCNEIDPEHEANGRASKSYAPPTTSDGVGAKSYIKSLRTILAFLVSSNFFFLERQCRIGKKLCHWKQKAGNCSFLIDSP